MADGVQQAKLRQALRQGNPIDDADDQRDDDGDQTINDRESSAAHPVYGC